MAIKQNTALLNCDTFSVMNSIAQSGAIGLSLESAIADAYLIPYGNECKLNISYQGLMRIARQSGQIASFSAKVVRKNDLFDYQEGTTPQIIHKPDLESSDAEVVAAYAVAFNKDGSHSFIVMSRSEIDKVMKSSKSSSGSSSPWKKWYEAMAQKTAIRNLCKWLPRSKDLDLALSVIDSELKGVDDVHIIEKEEPKTELEAFTDEILGEGTIAEEEEPQLTEEEENARHFALEAEKADKKKTTKKTAKK
jgi:recombination protein RecT